MRSDTFLLFASSSTDINSSMGGALCDRTLYMIDLTGFTARRFSAFSASSWRGPKHRPGKPVGAPVPKQILHKLNEPRDLKLC